MPVGSLAIDAIRAAAEDAGVALDEIDGLATYPNPSRYGAGAHDGVDFVGASYVARTLGLDVRWACQVMPGSFVGSVIEAANAVMAGACRYAVAWRAMHNPAGPFGRWEGSEARGPEQFTAPYGLANHVMAFALPYSRYLARYGARREDLGAFIVSNRRNASRNPEAIFRDRPLAPEDYRDDRMIAHPLSLLDCDMPVDGAGAVLITAADRARALRHRPAYVAGYAQHAVDWTRGAWSLEDFEAGAARVARTLWDSSGMTAADVDQPNLYDGFSYFIYIWLEAYGFCPRGEAWQFIQDGRIAFEGELPINTNGGALGMGRLHGTPQVIEAVRQLQGQAGQRQLPHVHVTLAASGMPTYACASILFTDAADA